MAWFIYSIAAHSLTITGLQIIHTVGALNASTEKSAQQKALLIAEKRWPKLVGSTDHSAEVLEVKS